MAQAFLVVEDDDSVRDFIINVLKHEGHDVLAAATVTDARQLIFARPDAHNLCLIIDIVLDQESGVAFAQELVKKYPGFRVLLVSGFTDDVLLSQPEDTANLGFLAKPFTQRELLAALANVCS